MKDGNKAKVTHTYEIITLFISCIVALAFIIVSQVNPELITLIFTNIGNVIAYTCGFALIAGMTWGGFMLIKFIILIAKGEI